MKLRSLGKSDDEIQSIYGIGPKQYRRYQRVSELPGELKVAINEGRLRTTHAIVILQAWEAHWVAERDRLLEEYFPARTAALIEQLQDAGLMERD